ncbi:MAG: hypothetical protein ACR2NL_02905 [Acidimicrobiia bacterium]
MTGVPPDVKSDDPGPYLDFSWVFALYEIDARSSRLILRTRARIEPDRLIPLSLAVLGPADIVMSRWMLKGIKARAESSVRPT